MKFTAGLLFLSATMAAASKTISGKSASKILRSARRAEENNNNNGQNNEYAYLGNYNLKMVSCKAGETVVNAENGEYQYGAVVLRLCPTASGCDSDSVFGCKAGFGDIVVSMQSFVEAYFEDQRDNMQWDDNFDVDKYAKCEQYKVENQGDDYAYGDYQFYIGATCTESGDDIRLALFEDEVCTYESSVAFEEISNGWSLPYTSGGLISTSCSDCMEYNDNGEYALREMCQRTYENAANKCETNMEYVSYYGANVQGCDYIQELLPAVKKSKKGGKVFGWMIFVLLIGGCVGYVMWWRKKKAGASGASNGMLA